MCVGPDGSCVGDEGLIPYENNRTAKNLSEFLKVCIVLLLLTSICFLLTVTFWLNGVIDLVIVIIGYVSIRNPDGFNMSCVLCFFMALCLDLFWSVTRSIQYFGKLMPNMCKTGAVWQQYVCIGVVIEPPLLYLISVLLSYYLYESLRKSYNDVYRDDFSETEIQQPVLSRGPDSSSGSFKSFTGTGHRLGGPSST